MCLQSKHFQSRADKRTFMDSTALFSVGFVPYLLANRFLVLREAEYMAMCQAAKEAIWLEGFLEDFWIDLKPSMVNPRRQLGSTRTEPHFSPTLETHRHSVSLHSGTRSNWSYYCQIHSHEGHSDRCAHGSTPSPSLTEMTGVYELEADADDEGKFVAHVLMTLSNNGGY